MKGIVETTPTRRVPYNRHNKPLTMSNLIDDYIKIQTEEYLNTSGRRKHLLRWKDLLGSIELADLMNIGKAKPAFNKAILLLKEEVPNNATFNRSRAILSNVFTQAMKGDLGEKYSIIKVNNLSNLIPKQNERKTRKEKHPIERTMIHNILKWAGTLSTD